MNTRLPLSFVVATLAISAMALAETPAEPVATPEFSADRVAQIVQDARQHGDARRGAEVFLSLQSACGRCHRLGEASGVLGPDLSQIGKTQTPEQIVESVLWPKRQVKDAFVLTTVVDTAGRQFQGYKLRESDTELVLRNLNGGEDLVLAKDQIDERIDGGTLMPDGVTNAMSDQQRRDLFRFLFDLGRDAELLADSIAAQNSFHGHHSGAPPEPAPFDYELKPLSPSHWPYWQAHVNRDRVYDFYGKQAAYYKAQVHAPSLLTEYPGLDNGKYGHWGNQNDEVWRDGRWNDSDLGGLLAGVIKLGDQVVAKGVAVQLGDKRQLAACFDPTTLGYTFVWKGKFLTFDSFRHGLIHSPSAAGDSLTDDETKRLAAPRPFKSFAYHGFYRHGERVVFHYTVDGVETLDAPWATADGRFERVVAPVGSHPLKSVLQGGPARWPQTLSTQGELGATRPLAVDTLTLPHDNPWKSLLFVGDHDFFASGDIALCTAMGEVWTCRGVDDRLEKLEWRRFATGLHQPLGLRVVDDVVHVLGRDQITRLHDLNDDGEADRYECFSNVQETSSGGHDYICGLQRDAAGNWYFASANQGLCKLDVTGRRIDVLAFGFRNPNGVGLLADGSVTTSVQEGDWTPASQVFLVPPGQPKKFCGYRGPRKDIATTPPLLYLPRGVDNSTGGQANVESDRWLLPRGSTLSFSFGTGSVQSLLIDRVDDAIQAAAWTLPGEFKSGVHRGRFSPRDSQLYVSGMQGWGTYTTDDGCLQRFRMTDAEGQAPLEFHARENGFLVTFRRPLDKRIAEDPQSHFVQAWNYRYSAAYGSPEFSQKWPTTPGHDPLAIGKCVVLPDGHTLFVEVPQLHPANTVHVQLGLGGELPFDLFATIHKLGPAFTDYAGYRRIPKVQLAAAGVVVPPAVPNPWAKGEPGREIKIATSAGLRFSTKRLTAKRGERLTLTLDNPDVMPHNWALCKPGTLAKVGDGANRMASQPDGGAKQYIPPGDDTLVYTDVVEPGKSFTIHFDAPKEPGEYPFLCSFPGHWQIMNGTMVVDE